MKKLAAMMICFSAGSCYAVAVGPSLEPVQALNTQIQAQLKTLQTTQAAQMQKMNTQIQKQIQTMQASFQTQMQKMNADLQTKMKTMQTTLEAEIKKVQQDAVKAH